MNALDAISANSSAAAATSPSRTALGQADFLRLMTTQMRHQDPFKPLDSSAFLGQIAQFSTVSGVQSLNASFTALSQALEGSQMLQGTQLVGHEVLVAGDRLQGAGEAAVETTVSGPVRVEIRDAGGRSLRTLDLGVRDAGLHSFQWDGLDAFGQAQPAGSYFLSAQSGSGSDAVAAQTHTRAQVRSVSLDSRGLLLHLDTASSARLADVRHIYQETP